MKASGTSKPISEKTLRSTLKEMTLTGTIRNLRGVSQKRRGEIMDELERRGYLHKGSIRVTEKGTKWLSRIIE